MFQFIVNSFFYLVITLYLLVSSIEVHSLTNALFSHCPFSEILRRSSCRVLLAVERFFFLLTSFCFWQDSYRRLTTFIGHCLYRRFFRRIGAKSKTTGYTYFDNAFQSVIVAASKTRCTYSSSSSSSLLFSMASNWLVEGSSKSRTIIIQLSTSSYKHKVRNVDEPSTTVTYVFFSSQTFGIHVISFFYISLYK